MCRRAKPPSPTAPRFVLKAALFKPSRSSSPLPQGKGKKSQTTEFTSPPLKYDLAARLAAFDRGVSAFQVGGVDLAEHLVERGFDLALVDEARHMIEQFMLLDHVVGLERRAGKHQFPMQRGGLALEWQSIERSRIVNQ